MLARTEQNFFKFISYSDTDMLPATEVPPRELPAPSLISETQETSTTGWYEKRI